LAVGGEKIGWARFFGWRLAGNSRPARESTGGALLIDILFGCTGKNFRRHFSGFRLGEKIGWRGKKKRGRFFGFSVGGTFS